MKVVVVGRGEAGGYGSWCGWYRDHAVSSFLFVYLFVRVPVSASVDVKSGCVRGRRV